MKTNVVNALVVLSLVTAYVGVFAFFDSSDSSELLKKMRQQEAKVRYPNEAIKSKIQQIMKLEPGRVVFDFYPDCRFDKAVSVTTTDTERIKQIATTLSESSRIWKDGDGTSFDKENLVSVTFYSKAGGDVEIMSKVSKIEENLGPRVREMFQNSFPEGWTIHISKESKHYPEEVLGPEGYPPRG